MDEPTLHTYRIVLELTHDPMTEDPPYMWDWTGLADTPTAVRVVDCRLIHPVPTNTNTEQE
jgi:hypothetical protein